MRFTIEEYANAYSISPEMVQSRLRRNRLNYIIENDTTYIVVPKHQVPFHTDDVSSAKHQRPNRDNEPSSAGEPVSDVKNGSETKAPQKKTTVATVIGLYQKENHYLKRKIEELEAKVDRLVDEKEQLLKEERSRIEKVYSDKDVQLKSILELINIKLLQENASSSKDFMATEVAIEGQLEGGKEKEPVELKQYLRSLDLKSSQRKSIKRRFAEAFGSDSRILLKNGLFYLDFDRYDYTDLLKLT
jgi:cell division protein FtsB